MIHLRHMLIRTACTNIFTLTNIITLSAQITVGSQGTSSISNIWLARIDIFFRKKKQQHLTKKYLSISSEIIWVQITTMHCTNTDAQCSRSIGDKGRPLQAVHYRCFWLVSHVFRHKICLQGQSPATYSVWVIGNDNCYILHLQQRGNLVSASVLQ